MEAQAEVRDECAAELQIVSSEWATTEEKAVANAEIDNLIYYFLNIRETCLYCRSHFILHLPTGFTLIQEAVARIAAFPTIPHSFMRGYFRRSSRPNLAARAQSALQTQQAQQSSVPHQQTTAPPQPFPDARIHATPRPPIRGDARDQLDQLSPSPRLPASPRYAVTTPQPANNSQEENREGKGLPFRRFVKVEHN